MGVALDPGRTCVLDLFLLTPVAAVLAAAAVVVRRERRARHPEPAPVPEEDPVVDLTFLQSAPREIDLRNSQLRSEAQGSLGARLRTVQLAQEAGSRPTVRTRRRRERPLIASR